MNIPVKYLPFNLTKKDKKKQAKQLKKSRSNYKKNIYFHRKKLDSFKSKKSQHIINAEKLYNIKNMKVNSTLAKKTGCSIKALNQIVKKGQGAYYSSGSWGYARLASSITGNKAAAVDYNILANGCKKNSKALKLANKARKKHKFGTRKVKKVNI